jgi:hypothetical protein
MMLRKVEIFQWDGDGNDRPPQHFYVTALLEAIKSYSVPAERISTYLDRAFAEKWVAGRALHMDYVRSMTEEQRKAPVLGVRMPDGGVLLIDGSHRYMACYLAGDETIDYVLVEHPYWTPFRIYGVLR